MLYSDEASNNDVNKKKKILCPNEFMYYKHNCSWLSCLSYLQDTESDCPVSVLIKGLERPCRGKVNGKWSVQGQELNNCSTPEPQLWLQFNTAGSWEHIKQTACSIKTGSLFCVCAICIGIEFTFSKSHSCLTDIIFIFMQHSVQAFWQQFLF